MKNFAAIVLAAGKGTRMKSRLPKVLHQVSGRPMLFYPLRALKEIGVKNIVAVVGRGAGDVKEALKGSGARFCLQKTQLGTGHAVRCAMKGLKGFRGGVIILSGDVPLVTAATLRALLKVHGRPCGRTAERPAVSFISAVLDNPSGYGRVMRDADGRVKGIIEDKDLKPAERDGCEVNSGIYLVDSEYLKKTLKKLGTGNKQKEYYLPDLVSIAYKEGQRVAALTHIDPEEVIGVNNRVELALANTVMRERILRGLMLAGVTFVDPSTAYVDYGVKVGRETTVWPNVHLLGMTVIGKDCVIEEGVRIQDSIIGDGAVVKSFSVIESSRIGRKVSIGPFARLRPGNTIKDSARIGNFVEVKNSTIGEGTKVNHLSYIGDSVIGKDVNIGAGTITCNYDGARKYRTRIEDGVFVGSDSQLVAPVTIGKGAYIGSGSTITKDVPAGALALSRAAQRVVKGWAKRRKK